MKKRHRRQHFTEGSLGRKPKVACSEADARAAGEAFGKCAYHCNCCGHWHIGGAAPKTSTDQKRPAATDIARAA